MATYNSTAAIDAILRANSAPVEAEMQAAQNNYDAAVKRLEAQKAAEDAQAYRSFERQKRELPEVMAMNGAQGGMVDSAVASMENNYMNNRNARALQLADNLADQQLNHDNAMLQLRAKLAAYQQQAEADKAELAYATAKKKTSDGFRKPAPGYVDNNYLRRGSKGSSHLGSRLMNNTNVMMET